MLHSFIFWRACLTGCLKILNILMCCNAINRLDMTSDQPRIPLFTIVRRTFEWYHEMILFFKTNVSKQWRNSSGIEYTDQTPRFYTFSKDSGSNRYQTVIISKNQHIDYCDELMRVMKLFSYKIFFTDIYSFIYKSPNTWLINWVFINTWWINRIVWILIWRSKQQCNG